MKEILNLFQEYKERHGLSNLSLILCADGSGRATEDWERPYESNPEFDFDTLKELKRKLKK